MSAEYLGCPWCGEQPEVTKHHKEDVWSLVHRCEVFVTLHTGWCELGSLKERWNTRDGVVPTNGRHQ